MLLANDVDLLVFECKTVQIKISTSGSETMVLSWHRVDCPLQVRDEILPYVEEFKCLGVLFRGERIMM